MEFASYIQSDILWIHLTDELHRVGGGAHIFKNEFATIYGLNSLLSLLFVGRAATRSGRAHVHREASDSPGSIAG